MNLGTLGIFFYKKKSIICISLSIIFLLLSQEKAISNGSVVVPLDIVNFEAPVLPPPLWRTNSIVMNELALPRIPTFSEREKSPPSKFSLIPRFRTVINYEWVDGDFGQLTIGQGEFKDRATRQIRYDGEVISGYLQVTWQKYWALSQIEFGTFMVYDHLNFKDSTPNHVGFDTDRLGTIIFGKYKTNIYKYLDAALTVSGNWIYNTIDSSISNENYNDYNTFGSNISLSLEFDTKNIYREITLEKRRQAWIYFAGGISFSYHFQIDDVEREGIENNERVVDEVNDQHLLMLGLNFGARIYNNVAITLFGVWNYDTTNYRGSLFQTDTDYFDIGIEGVWYIGSTLQLEGGYKKIIAYEELDLDQMFVGVSWKF